MELAVISQNESHIQSVFRALGDPTRRNILISLSEQDLSIAEVADRFPISRAAVKKHLSILEQGQLISVRKRGRERVNRLEAQNLKLANDWLNYFSQFWDTKLNKLQQAIHNHQENSND